MSRIRELGQRLYRGDVSYDFVGRRKRWYLISAGILLAAVAGLLLRGLHLGVDFEGGNVATFPSKTGSVSQAIDVARSIGSKDPTAAVVSSPSGRQIKVVTESLSTEAAAHLTTALAQRFDLQPNQISVSAISADWGSEITSKALTGLGVFLVLIVAFLSVYFEWRLAAAALVALVHDLVITVGVYALVGFIVTPATVIGVLTILGYSLYDTVVVFDKVRENTRGLAGGNRMTYSSAANLAVNQTLVRSINTSVIALLPVASILFVGPLLGAETLKDLALALFVGIAAGTYSSIFIATPVAAQLKEREPAMQALAKRVSAREAAGKLPSAAVPVGAAAPSRSGNRSAPPAAAATAVLGDGDDDDLGVDDTSAGESVTRVLRSGGVSGGATPPRRPAGPGSGTARKRSNKKKRR